MKILSRFSKWFLIGILAAIVGSIGIGMGAIYFFPERFLHPRLIPPESTKLDLKKPLREQTRTIEIAGRTFEIPIMYFDTRVGPGKKKDSILLEVIWPEMQSTYELGSKAEYDRIWRDEHRLGWILLHPASMRPPLDEQTANRRRGLTKEEYIGIEAGLEKYLWYHGLPEDPELWAELYFERNENGQIITRIECRTGPGVVVPSCSHKFINEGFIYQISYNRMPFFPEWRQQQQRAIDFMRSLEILSGNKPSPTGE